VHVLAVGVGRAQQRAEKAVKARERLGRVRGERHVGFFVVADRERVAVGAQEAVHAPAVEFGAPALPRVVVVEMATALEEIEAVRGQRLTGAVGELQPGLASVGPRQPAEVVVERAVLHHQHHERVDREVARRRKLDLALAPGGLGHERVGIQHQAHAGGQARGHGGAPEEIPSRVQRLGSDCEQALRLPRIANAAHGPDLRPMGPSWMRPVCDRALRSLASSSAATTQNCVGPSV
jgi:hypothetical protein